MLRVFLSLCESQDVSMQQMEVATAFLNGDVY